MKWIEKRWGNPNVVQEKVESVNVNDDDGI
jgi:hypothetical protein